MNILLIAITVIFILITGFVIYKYLKMNTVEKIRADVYQLFLKVEHSYQKTGLQKMEWVVQKARSLLPEWAKLIITDDFLKYTLQIWFNGVKDLLDDGKLNNSEKGVEENVERN